jgi:hypothetical protein
LSPTNQNSAIGIKLNRLQDTEFNQFNSTGRKKITAKTECCTEPPIRKPQQDLRLQLKNEDSKRITREPGQGFQPTSHHEEIQVFPYLQNKP